MRKFLMVTYHFPPSQAVAVHRMLGLVRYLPRAWLAADRGGSAQRARRTGGRRPAEAHPAGTPIYRVSLSAGTLGQDGPQILSLRLLAAAGHEECAGPWCSEHRPEAVLTSSPPPCVSYLGEYLKNKFGLPWLADYRDPSYANNPIPQGSHQQVQLGGPARGAHDGAGGPDHRQHAADAARDAGRVSAAGPQDDADHQRLRPRRSCR